MDIEDESIRIAAEFARGNGTERTIEAFGRACAEEARRPLVDALRELHEAFWEKTHPGRPCRDARIYQERWEEIGKLLAAEAGGEPPVYDDNADRAMDF